MSRFSERGQAAAAAILNSEEGKKLIDQDKATRNEPHFSKAVDILQPVKPQIKPLEVFTANQISESDATPPPFVIDGLLPAGMTVFAAPPKTGKSWFCMDMACAIAEGKPFWGRRTTPGDVLYLDLESRNYRVKERLQKTNLHAPHNLYFTFKAASLDAGLLEQLSTWKEQHPNASTIIIDTLGRVKGASKKNADAYSADTAALAPIQEWALNNGIAVLCITHLKKAGSSRYAADADPFEMITGSNGQFAVADSAWIITGKRDDVERHFLANGRDIEALDLTITFDRSAFRWKCLGDTEQLNRDMARRHYQQSPIVKTIVSMLASASASCIRLTASELCDAVAQKHGTAGCTPIEMGRKLSQLSEQLYAYDKIVYEPPASGGRSGRLHSFKYEKQQPITTEQTTL